MKVGWNSQPRTHKGKGAAISSENEDDSGYDSDWSDWTYSDDNDDWTDDYSDASTSNGSCASVSSTSYISNSTNVAEQGSGTEDDWTENETGTETEDENSVFH